MKKLIIFIVLIPFSLVALPNQGKQQIDSLEIEYRKAGADTNKVLIADQLAYKHSLSNPEKGLEYAKQAMQLSTRLNWERGKARAHSALAVNYGKKSEHELAFRHYMASYKLFEKLGNNSGAAGALANLSMLHKANGNYPKALGFAYKALKTFEELKDSLNTAIILENIGTIFLEQKKYDKALSYYKKSQGIYRALNNLSGEARIYGNLGIIYGAKGNHQEALNHHLYALEMKKVQGNKYSQQVSLANIGIAYKNMHNYSQALQNHFEALEISSEMGDKHSNAVNMGNIGDTYMAIASDNLTDIAPDKYIAGSKSANRRLAIKYLKDAIELCEELKFYGPMIEFSMTLSDAYLSDGNYISALGSYKLHARLKDSIYSLGNQTAISNLETRRELELKERDIIIQKNQLQIAKLKSANQRKERLIFLGGFALFTIGIVLTVQRYRKYIARQKSVLDDISQFQSHNIRGPVARMLGLTQLFNHDDIHDPMNSKIIQHVRTVAIQLDEVVRKIIQKAEAE